MNSHPSDRQNACGWQGQLWIDWHNWLNDIRPCKMTEMSPDITDLQYASLGGKTQQYIIMVIGITDVATTSYIYKWLSSVAGCNLKNSLHLSLAKKILDGLILLAEPMTLAECSLWGKTYPIHNYHIDTFGGGLIRKSFRKSESVILRSKKLERN